MLDLNFASIAYLWSLIVWIPILCYVVFARPTESKVFFYLPMAASMLASMWEFYMSFIWTSKGGAPIRVDIILFFLLLSGIDAWSGGMLLFKGRGKKNRPKTRPGLIVLGMVYLSVPILAGAVFIDAFADIRNLSNRNELAGRLRFEAMFRSDVTQRRFFGPIDSSANPWSGYYVSDDMIEWYKHLVINAEGKFWLINVEGGLYRVEKGEGHQSPERPDRFDGEFQLIDSKIKLSLKRMARDNFVLRLEHNYPDTNVWHLYGGEVHFRKAAPPRYPDSALLSGPVRFLGVYSAKFDTSGKSFFVIQVWLWGSRGAVWGRLLRTWFEQGMVKQFLSAEPTEGKCSEDYRTIELPTSSPNFPILLTRLPDGRYIASGSGLGKGVVLNRGEIVPGFIFDLATQESEAKNKAWLEAVGSLQVEDWHVPNE